MHEHRFCNCCSFVESLPTSPISCTFVILFFASRLGLACFLRRGGLVSRCDCHVVCGIDFRFLRLGETYVRTPCPSPLSHHGFGDLRLALLAKLVLCKNLNCVETCRLEKKESQAPRTVGKHAQLHLCRSPPRRDSDRYVPFGKSVALKTFVCTKRLCKTVRRFEVHSLLKLSFASLLRRCSYAAFNASSFETHRN